jgi:glycosyltransferase involved in cell wall biosynthesis
MRVLILHNQLWTQYKSVVFQGIYEEFKKSGDNILVLQTSICEKSRLNILDFNPANFKYTYPYILLNHKSLEDSNPFRTTFLWIYYIIKFKPDVINLTGYSEIGTIFVLIYAKIFNIKTLMTNESIHSNRLHKPSISKCIIKSFKNFIIQLTDGFLSYGIKSNDYLFRFRISKRRILSFLNSFDRSKFHSDNSQVIKSTLPYILFVGRLSEEKNLTSLIELARLFVKDSLSYRIKIIGEGDEYNNLNSLISKENLPIDLEGAKNWNQLDAIYKSSIAFILPSLIETWGMVANEALEMGIPVICSSACGCADDLVINEVNGLVLSDFNFNNHSNVQTYKRLKTYLLENAKTSKAREILNRKIASIYDETKLIDEFIIAFRKIA